MDNIIYTLFVSIFVPLLLMTLLVEKKARFPLVFVLIGIFISVFAAEVNGLLAKVLSMDRYSITVIVTPVSEELLKALPILCYALVISDKREKLFTASMATGIGFAVLENAFYLLNSPNFSMLSAVIRAFGTGLMHGMCTLLVGVGISFVKKKSKLFAVGTFGLLSTAIVYHGIYNILIQSEYSIVGALLPIATYIPFFIWRIKNKKLKHLEEKK
jgi:RsiW-degrading membrane proteinase PrsW (M82 family)